MERIQFFGVLLIAASLCFTSCSKTGPQGPQGEQGAAGVKGDKGDAGLQGPSGQNGNANVIAYSYNSKTFTGSLDLSLGNISLERIDSSMVVVYYNPSSEVSTSWYQCPGLGSTGAYQTRYLIYQASASPSTYTLSIKVHKPDGSNYAQSLTFTKIRIFLVKTTSILGGGRRSSPPDFNDYHAVCQYYGISE